GVAVSVPPPLLARVTGQLDQVFPLLGGHAVQLEHVADIPGRDRHPSGLDATDLRGRAFQVLRYLLARESGGFAEPPEFGREPSAPDRRAVLASHLSPPPQARDVLGVLKCGARAARRPVTTRDLRCNDHNRVCECRYAYCIWPDRGASLNDVITLRRKSVTR